MFQFKDENKTKNIKIVQEKLENLVAKIESLESMEVGVNFTDSPRAFDLSLYSTFADKEALQAYAIHEEHLKVVAFIKDVTTQSKVVDYIL